jgi:hypothetical protein
VGSATNIFNLLRKQDQPRPANAGFVGDERQRQLTAWQEKWTRTLLQPTGTQLAGQQECRSLLTKLPSPSLAGQVRQVTSINCEGLTDLALGANYSAGFNVLRGQAYLINGTGGVNEADLAKALAGDYFAALDKRAETVNLMTVPECRTENAVNARGQNVHVRFCTSALKNEDSINDTVVSVTRTSMGTQVAFAAAHLRGFSQANTKRVIASLMDKVGEESAPPGGGH